MIPLPTSSILVPATRQRQEFAPIPLAELMDSIGERGLIHPLTVRVEEGTYVLVAGERRLRAIKDLWAIGGTLRMGEETFPQGVVPVINWGVVTALEAEELELAENIRRADLAWQERAQATSRIANLRSGQAANAGKPAPSVADISLEVRGSAEGSNQQATRREIIIEKHLGDPEVAKAKSLEEAWKILKKREEVADNTARGVAVGKTLSRASHTLHNADALEWLASCPADSFDVILTDPPYGMGADEFGDSGGKAEGAHAYADDEATALRCYNAVAYEGFRVTKPQAHLYAFCDLDYFASLKLLFAEAGWWVHRTPLIWHKPNASRVPWPEHGPQRKYELCLYAVKGKRPVTKIAPDVVSYNPDPNLGHSAQKPVALFEDFLKRSVRPGDSALDPFCGTGPVFQAAHNLKCFATGIEKDPASYGIALKRIEGIK